MFARPGTSTKRDASSAAWLGLALIAAAVAAYWPALGGGLVWDDDAHLTRGALQGWDGLWNIWFTPGATQQYYPVLHSAFWLEHWLWGDATLGYHLANVLWLAVAALLLVVLAERLRIRGAWVAAFVFALHPVHVESVAWMSEQKNTLSLLFYLASAIAWTRFDGSRRRRDWALAFALFALALGSKTVTATLPAALLVVVWWQRGRIDWRRDVLPLVPWFAIGVAAGLGTAWMERHVIGADGDEFTLSAAQHLVLAARVVWHYLRAFAWPSPLMFMYPRWPIDAASASAWVYPLALVGAFAALWRLRVRRRAPLAALLIFVGTLVPVLGFLNVYPFRYSWVADHFQYHADVPLALMCGAGTSWLFARARRGVPSLVVIALVSFALAGLGALTYRQTGEYRDAETLYRATLAKNPTSWMAHHNLGRLVSRKPGGLDEAIGHFEAAIALKPNHARAHYALGVALQRVGRGAEAVPHFEAAVRYEPNNPVLVANAEYLLGLEALRRPDGAAEAVRHLTEAVRRKPGIAETAQALERAKALAARDSLRR